MLGPLPPQPIELWDNDGIVNTVSMLWPGDETVLVQADHLDIVGHYWLRPAQPAVSGAPRTYQSYDSLKSSPLFKTNTFDKVWTEIFFFAAMPKVFAQNRNGQHIPVKIAAAAAVAC